MKSISASKRKHHFVPKFYLAGFTGSGIHDGDLYTLDILTNKIWKSTPANVAFERDFYAITSVGYRRDHVEDFYSRVESHMAPIIERIRREVQLPAGQDMTDLLFFFTLLMTRVPKFRRQLHETRDSLQQGFGMDLAFYDFVLTLREDEIPDGASYLDLKKAFFAFRNWDVVNAEVSVGTAEKIAAVFLDRHWSVVARSKDSIPFVLPDCPVIPSWTKSHMKGFPPLASKDVQIFVPISKDIALIGNWDRYDRFAEVDSDFVERVNLNSLAWAERFIYSDSKSVLCDHRHIGVKTLKEFAVEVRN